MREDERQEKAQEENWEGREDARNGPGFVYVNGTRLPVDIRAWLLICSVMLQQRSHYSHGSGTHPTPTHSHALTHTSSCTSSQWLQAHSQNIYDLICEWSPSLFFSCVLSLSPFSHTLTHRLLFSALTLTYACSHCHTQGRSCKCMQSHTHWPTSGFVVVSIHRIFWK